MEDLKKNHSYKPVVIAEEIEPKLNQEYYDRGICSIVFIFILTILAFNLLALMYGIFGIVALTRNYSSWRTWRRVSRIFFVVGLVFLGIFMLAAIITIVKYSVDLHVIYIVFNGIYLLLSAISIPFLVKLDYELAHLYGALLDQKKLEPNYTNDPNEP